MSWMIALLPLTLTWQASTQPPTYSLEWRPKAGQILEYKVRLQAPLTLDERVTFESKLRVRVATSYGSNHSEVLDFSSGNVSSGEDEDDLDDVPNLWIHQGPIVNPERAGQFAWVLGTFADRSLRDKEVKLGSRWTLDTESGETDYNALALETIAGKKALRIAFDSHTKDKDLLCRGAIWISIVDGAPLKASYDFPAKVSSDEETNEGLVSGTLEYVGESKEPPLPSSGRTRKAYEVLSDFLSKSTTQYSEEARNLKNYEVQFQEDDVTLVVKLVPKVKGLEAIIGVFDREKIDLKAVFTGD